MIYFENDFIDNHGTVICDSCNVIIAEASTVKQKFVDWNPDKKICLPCAREGVTDKSEFDSRVAAVAQIGKSKFVYYNGKLAI